MVAALLGKPLRVEEKKRIVRLASREEMDQLPSPALALAAAPHRPVLPAIQASAATARRMKTADLRQTVTPAPPASAEPLFLLGRCLSLVAYRWPRLQSHRPSPVSAFVRSLLSLDPSAPPDPPSSLPLGLLPASLRSIRPPRDTAPTAGCVVPMLTRPRA